MEVLSSPSGMKTVRIDGKYVCSSIDPVQEGRRWAERNSPKKGIGCLIVLGLGCAYHTRELQSLFPHLKIIAIETRTEFSEFAKELGISQSIQVIVPPIRGDFSIEMLPFGVTEIPYQVVRYGPVFESDRDFYKQIEQTLLGRSWSGMRQHLKLRIERNPWLAETLEKNPTKETSTNLSLQALDPFLEKAEIMNREVAIFKALRELIK
jgi:hypothetical protein